MVLLCRNNWFVFFFILRLFVFIPMPGCRIICVFPVFLWLIFVSVIGCKKPAKKDDLELLNKVATNETVTTLEAIHDQYGVAAADYYLDTAFQAKESSSLLNFYRYYYHKAYVLNHFVHDYNAALTYISILIDKLETQKIYDALTAEAYFVKGDTYILLKNFPQAYRYYSVGINLCLMMDNKVARSRQFDRFGLILYRQKYYKEARKYFFEAYAEISKEDTSFIPQLKKQELLDNIALCYTNEGYLDSAILFYDSALAEIKKFGNREDLALKPQRGAEGVVLGNKAKVYLMQGDVDKAIALYKKSIELTLSSIKLREDAGYSLVHLADIYLSQKNIHEADLIIDTLEAIVKDSQNTEMDQEFRKYLLRLKRESAMQKKDWENAAKSADEHLKILTEEGSGNEKRNSDINDVLASFEKEQQMLNLVKENKFNKNINILIGVLFVLSLIIVFVIFYSWRSSRQRTSELELLNKRIEDQKLQLEKNNATLLELNQEKDKILSIAAHDLRNPVSAVKSITHLIEGEEAVKNSQEVKTLLALMAKASDSAMELINEILILAKLKSAVDNKMERISTNEFLKVTTDLLKNRANEKEIELVLLPSMPDVDIAVDAERFRRAVSNLLVNAIKFSYKGAKIWIGASVLADRVHIYVKDQGIGIPEKIRGQVFDTFSAAKRAGTSNEPAYGLGLSIVKQIVGEHSGSVWFDSEEGKGTTFYIAIPACM